MCILYSPYVINVLVTSIRKKPKLNWQTRAISCHYIDAIGSGSPRRTPEFNGAAGAAPWFTEVEPEDSCRALSSVWTPPGALLLSWRRQCISFHGTLHSVLLNCSYKKKQLQTDGTVDGLYKDCGWAVEGLWMGCKSAVDWAVEGLGIGCGWAVVGL